MSSFADKEGREWSLTFTVGNARMVKQRTGCDFANAWDGKAAQVFDDDNTLASVLWLLCLEQASERNVSENQFFNALDREAMDAAGEAMREAVLNFCPPVKRPALEAAFEQAAKAKAKAVEAALQRINGEKFAAALESQLTKAERAMDEKLESLIGGPSSSA